MIIPTRMRDGVPLCPDMGCDTPMVQIAEPSEEFPGGRWQCPIGKAQLDAIRDGLARAFERIAAESGA